MRQKPKNRKQKQVLNKSLRFSVFLDQNFGYFFRVLKNAGNWQIL